MPSAAVNEMMPCLSFNHGAGHSKALVQMLRQYATGLQIRGVVVVEAHVQADPLEVAGETDLSDRVTALLGHQGIASRFRSSNIFPGV